MQTIPPQLSMFAVDARGAAPWLAALLRTANSASLPATLTAALRCVTFAVLGTLACGCTFTIARGRVGVKVHTAKSASLPATLTATLRFVASAVLGIAECRVAVKVCI